MKTKKKATEKKNVDTTKNLKKFGKDKPPANPSPESKKQGWERRRLKMQLMDTVLHYLNEPIEEVEKKLATLKKDNPTLLEAIGLKYASKVFNSDKFMVDFLDRHVGKAPLEVESNTKLDIGYDFSQLSDKELKDLAQKISKVKKNE